MLPHRRREEQATRFAAAAAAATSTGAAGGESYRRYGPYGPACASDAQQRRVEGDFAGFRRRSPPGALPGASTPPPGPPPGPPPQAVPPKLEAAKLEAARAADSAAWRAFAEAFAAGPTAAAGGPAAASRGPMAAAGAAAAANEDAVGAASEDAVGAARSSSASSLPSASAKTRLICEADVPWPSLGDDAPLPGVELLAASGSLASGGGEAKVAVRALQRRWHSDKFVQRFGPRLEPTQREAILRRVVAVCQAINAIALD